MRHDTKAATVNSPKTAQSFAISAAFFSRSSTGERTVINVCWMKTPKYPAKAKTKFPICGAYSILSPKDSALRFCPATNGVIPPASSIFN